MNEKLTVDSVDYECEHRQTLTVVLTRFCGHLVNCQFPVAQRMSKFIVIAALFHLSHSQIDQSPIVTISSGRLAGRTIPLSDGQRITAFEGELC